MASTHRFIDRHEEILKEILQARSFDQRNGPLPENTNQDPLQVVNSRDLFRRYMNRLGLKTDSEFLLNISIGDDFEIWSPEMSFIGCSHGFMRASSYSFQQLAETDWEILFHREAEQKEKIVHAINAMASGQSFVPNVTNWHYVEETSAKRVKIEIRIKATGIAFDSQSVPQAFVAITQLKHHPGCAL